VLVKAAIVKDHTCRQHFISKKTIHQGRKPQKSAEELDRIKKLYDELRQRDRVVALTLLVHKMRQNNVSLQDLSVRSLRWRLHPHSVKLGVVKRRVTRVAHNIWYGQTSKQQYVQYIHEQKQIGHYRPQDIISIDETNLYFDQALGETLADQGEKMIGCAVTGSVNLYTILLACTVSGEKLPPYIIFKGKDTRVSHVGGNFPPYRR
jgi:SPX domain protein involved in polyphosphate accumulation